MDYNIVVIGGGSGGLVSAYLAAALEARVALVEKDRMGGDCLNTGCVPSKTLIRTTRLLADIRRHRQLGIRRASAEFDFAEVMERVQQTVARIAPHDSAERYRGLGVDVIDGAARVVSPHEVRVGDRKLTTKNLVLATGARPFVPDLPGLADVEPLHSENVWGLREKPQRLLVLGGGPIGCELAQCFLRLGCQVTMLERGKHLLRKEDPEITDFVLGRFRHEGMFVHLRTEAFEFGERDGQRVARVGPAHGEPEREIPFDRVLVALGRRPNTSGFGLEELGVETDDRGRIAIDKHGGTSVGHVYATGDCASPYQFTHMAAHGAYYCVVNALFAPFRQRIRLAAVPWCTYTEPEVARVGHCERSARDAGIEYEVTRYDLHELDRAICEGENYGMIKVLTRPGKDTILGASIVGHNAGEIIAEFVQAMNHGLGLKKILGTIHIYPTMAEANRYVAGEWRRRTGHETILNWLGRFHAWRRG